MSKQPEATCAHCAEEFGRYVMGRDAAWSLGQCGVCGARETQVTNPWNIAGLRLAWRERAALIPKHEKPKAQLEFLLT